MQKELQQLVCPPGDGVFTVNTAKEKKEQLQKQIYHSTNVSEISNHFHALLDSLDSLKEQQVALLGVCSDTGGGIQRGANWGPLFIREGLYQLDKAKSLVDLGDIRVIPHLLHDKYLNTDTIKKCQKALYGEVNDLPVSPLSMTEYFLNDCYKSIKNFRLLALGGDHSVSYPLVKSFLQAKKDQGKKVALIHFDAHTDLLKERLGIDLCFGSWVTHILPLLDSPNLAIQLGIRSSGKDKSYWQETFGIQQFWAKEIEKDGINHVIDRVLAFLSKEAIDELYISFDIDALDAAIAGSTGTPEPNGLSLADAKLAIQRLSKVFTVTGADCVEVAPFVYQQGFGDQAATLNAAVSICDTLLCSMAIGG